MPDEQCLMAQSNGQIRVIIDGLNDTSETVIKRLTLDVTSNLIETNPVDTGWSKANWVPSIGAPLINASISGTGNISTATATQSQGIANIVTQYTLDKGDVFVTNNVPYVPKLNDGHSNQAPAGFIQRAILKAVIEL